jgi:hypothetical protein
MHTNAAKQIPDQQHPTLSRLKKSLTSKNMHTNTAKKHIT